MRSLMTYQEAYDKHIWLCEQERHRPLTKEEWALMRLCEQVMMFEDSFELGM